ncbi:MAG: hypothetical protein GY774_20005 [Planctomycetes bacterium]|nr:hypothetical protein [Planctomycetota bacterium]
MIKHEIEIASDLTYSEMAEEVEILTGKEIKEKNTTTFGMTQGWMEHTPDSTFRFSTIAAAKRSTRNFWNGDSNDYVIVYNRFGGTVEVSVAVI